jgi:hypothetical protein
VSGDTFAQKTEEEIIVLKRGGELDDVTATWGGGFKNEIKGQLASGEGKGGQVLGHR